MSMQRSVFSLARPFVAALLFSSLIAAPALLSAQKPYHLLDRWKIGGDGGWDYLLADSAAHRLYITHGPRVEVVDTTTGKPVGAITGLHGTHGIALDDAGKFGYISDGGGNAVVVFDRATLAIVATIPPAARILTASSLNPPPKPSGLFKAAATMQPSSAPPRARWSPPSASRQAGVPRRRRQGNRIRQY